MPMRPHLQSPGGALRPRITLEGPGPAAGARQQREPSHHAPVARALCAVRQASRESFEAVPLRARGVMDRPALAPEPGVETTLPRAPSGGQLLQPHPEGRLIVRQSVLAGGDRSPPGG
jgi:hypothetical protein